MIMLWRGQLEDLNSIEKIEFCFLDIKKGKETFIIVVFTVSYVVLVLLNLTS